MKILFFGTPHFAEIVLEGLVKAKKDVVGVVCQNDKPAGRGGKTTSPKIKAIAESFSIPVYQFEKLREHIDDFKKIGYDIAVTASYGKILPKALLDIAPCINVHPSLLPKYRGATPIQSALLNGDEITGVSIMKTEVGMDDGDIYEVEKMEILPEDDYQSLEERLANLGVKLLLKTLEKISNNTAKRTSQDDSKATYVKLIQKEDALLDFSLPAKDLVNKVRAFCVNPVAFFNLGDDRIKVYRAQAQNMNTCANVGEILENRKHFYIQTGAGVLEILQCQSSGGKRLCARDFLNGYHFKTRQVTKC